MKLLLIISLYLIPGPAVGVNVTGFSGGSVLAVSTLQWDSINSKYICKLKQTICTDIVRSHHQSLDVQKGRFRLFGYSDKTLLVLIRKLKIQDAGMYRIGVENKSSYDVNLDVCHGTDYFWGRKEGRKERSCWGTINTYLEENITCTWSYPKQFEMNEKHVFKLDEDGTFESLVNTTGLSQNGRVSISDDTRAQVIKVNIKVVREDDEGAYLCGAWNHGELVSYYSFFTEVHLQVPVYRLTSAAPTTDSKIATYFRHSSIITVSICLPLLFLAGVFVLIFYKMRLNIKSQASPQTEPTSLSLNENIKRSLIQDDLVLPRNQADSIYQSLNSITNRSDSVYQTLNLTTNQSDFFYQHVNHKI